jgi:hypothetical protein
MERPETRPEYGVRILATGINADVVMGGPAPKIEVMSSQSSPPRGRL